MTTIPSGFADVQAGDARAAALRATVVALGEEPGGQGAVDAVALGLVDAVLAGDRGAVRTALSALRARRADAPSPAAAGAASAFAATAHWALERLPGEAEAVAPGTLAWRFLAALADGPAGSSDLRATLRTDDTQVSRTGARLLDAGLVLRRKTGRRVSWELGPRGRAAMAAGAGHAGATGPPRRAGGDAGAGRPGGDMAWWRELLRTSWRAPSTGHASDDPVRDRIVDAALGLHVSHGVLATTWEQIAARAGVPVAAVEQRFATVEDLVPACGGLAFRKLRLPPPEDAPAVFAGADAHERLERLVTTLFALYDRAAPSVETLRRDGGRLPVLGRARDTVEESIDGLVTAALDPALRAPETVGLVRALTDVPVWRAVRAAGAGDAAAVEAVAAALVARVGAGP